MAYAYQFENEETEDEVQADDYVYDDYHSNLCQSGNVLFHGEYDEAITFACKHMEKARYWPNIWWQSDHGNIELVFVD